MAIDTGGSHPDMEMEEKVATYKGFIRIMQIATICLAALLALMATFLV